uniref:Uncharacterized protein n=1 Tax=Alexandrium monilatum TaxID=311494 RepID=A0A7S4UE00_9DINO
MRAYDPQSRLWKILLDSGSSHWCEQWVLRPLGGAGRPPSSSPVRVPPVPQSTCSGEHKAAAAARPPGGGAAAGGSDVHADSRLAACPVRRREEPSAALCRQLPAALGHREPPARPPGEGITELDSGEEGADEVWETDDVWHMDWTALPRITESPLGASPGGSSTLSVAGNDSAHEVVPRPAAGLLGGAAEGLQRDEPNLVPSVIDVLQRELRSLCQSGSFTEQVEAPCTDRESLKVDELPRVSSGTDKENALLDELRKVQGACGPAEVTPHRDAQGARVGCDANTCSTQDDAAWNSPISDDLSSLFTARDTDASCCLDSQPHGGSHTSGGYPSLWEERTERDAGASPKSPCSDYGHLAEPTAEPKVDISRLQQQACRPAGQRYGAAARWLESEARAMRCRRHLKHAKEAGTVSRWQSCTPGAPTPQRPKHATAAARPARCVRPTTPGPTARAARARAALQPQDCARPTPPDLAARVARAGGGVPTRPPERQRPATPDPGGASRVSHARGACRTPERPRPATPDPAAPRPAQARGACRTPERPRCPTPDPVARVARACGELQPPHRARPATLEPPGHWQRQGGAAPQPPECPRLSTPDPARPREAFLQLGPPRVAVLRPGAESGAGRRRPASAGVAAGGGRERKGASMGLQ